MHSILRATIVAAAMTGWALSANAADSDLARELRDRAEIQELMWNYVRALDSLNEEAYITVFTEDGEFITGRNTATKGHAALKKMVADLKQARAAREAKGEPKAAPMYHVIANSHLEFLDKDRARFHSYWMTVFGANGPETPPRVAAAGRGVDELVRVNGRWLIKSRNVSPQD